MSKSHKTTPQLRRRQFLRGTAGFSLALPFLPSLTSRAEARTAAPPRFIGVCSEHGGIWAQHMFPSDATLSETRDYAGHEIRRGPLRAQHTGGRASISTTLSAASDQLSDGMVARMNLIRGIDHTYYIGHHRGGQLGNYADSDQGPTAVQPTPTVDQVMAWSPSFYGELGSIRERSLVAGHGNRASWGFANPQNQTGAVQAMPNEASSLALFDRLFAGADDGTPQRAPIVDRVRDHYRSLRESNRSLSANDRRRLDEHMERLFELERRLNAQLDCGEVTRPSEDAIHLLHDPGFHFDPAAQIRYWQLFNDVIVAAMACDASRIATMRLSDIFDSYAGDWHQDIAHQAHLPEQQAILQAANQRMFEGVFVDLINKLDIDIGDGQRLIEHCLVLWTQESGNITHDSISSPLVTVGSAGGRFRTGQYLDYRCIGRWWGEWGIPEMPAGEFKYVGLSHNQWLGTLLEGMGLPRAEFERNPDGGYGDPHVSEYATTVYPRSVLAARGETLPWLL